MFFKQYYPKAEGRAPTHVFGNNDASNPTIEASLDVEYIMAIGSNVDTIVGLRRRAPIPRWRKMSPFSPGLRPSLTVLLMGLAHSPMSFR